MVLDSGVVEGGLQGIDGQLRRPEIRIPHPEVDNIHSEADLFVAIL
jgi:hypothetical protein